MRVLVPFDAADPNTRLSSTLDDAERRAFAAAMCRDVLDAVREAGGDPELIATAPASIDAPVSVDERSLSTCVNARLGRTAEPVAVVMADLALATPTTLGRLFGTDGDVVLAPGRGGGTNAMVVRHPDFRVDYHGASYRDHRANARAVGARAVEFDSFRLSTDVDEPADLVEVLLHADGRAAAWLREAGFAVADTGGRVVARR